MKIFIITLITVIAIGAVSYFVRESSGSTKTVTFSSETKKNTDNVSIVEGKQIIEIKAKGGYFPRISTAQAKVPTVLRFNTNSTFDCSSSLRIPSINFSKILPNSGSTDVDLGSPEPGVLRGACSMGMYSFEINFQS